MKRILISTYIALAAALTPAAARAQACDAGESQTALQLLRRLSLDLRGHVPSFDELQQVATQGRLDPALIDQMLASNDFVAEMRAYHKELLWTNLSAQRLAQFNWILSPPGMRNGVMVPAYWAPGRAVANRGVQEPCLDEPARTDAMGNLVTTPDATRPNVKKEGWVMVSPYWAPTTSIKVCAFDARTAPTSLDARGNMLDCSRQTGGGCGCGESLRWCQSTGDKTEATITAAFAEQMFRLVDDIVRSDRPYTDVLLAKDAEVNGPLSHYFRYQTGAGGTLVLGVPNQNYTVPEVAFSETAAWTRVDRGHRHAGLLTLPGYLLKFQSDRGRANRFYNAFLCQAFQAPPGGLPAAADDCNKEPDLTQRCGCMYCHVTVEPAAAFWGRWSEAGLIPMEEALFPTRSPRCADPRTSNNNTCNLFYLTKAATEKEKPFLGMLKPYVFADATRMANIDVGPEGLAHQAIDSGQFAACTTKKLWSRLMGRAIDEGDAAALDELAAAFAQGGYKVRALVKAIVTRPEYQLGERYAMSMGGMP